MEIFLTGGTGFIGSHFIELASRHNIKINAIRRKRENQTKIKLTNNPNWINKEFKKIDIKDFNNSDVLIHLASHSTNVPYDSIENCLRFNVFETLELFNKAYKAGIRKFIMTGSSFEYGRKAEEYEYIPPDAPLFPTQSYPASKAAASIVLTQWALEKKVSLKILRLFQVFGEGELASRLWPSLKKCALEGNNFKMTLGEQIRDFINVKDVAKQIIYESKKFTNNSITIKNVGSGKPTKIKDFATAVWKDLNAKGEIELGALPYRKNEVMRYVPDIKTEYIIQ